MTFTQTLYLFYEVKVSAHISKHFLINLFDQQHSILAIGHLPTVYYNYVASYVVVQNGLSVVSTSAMHILHLGN